MTEDEQNAIDILGRDFELVAQVTCCPDRRDDVARIVRAHEDILARLPGWLELPSFSNQLDRFVDTLVHPDDRDHVRARTARDVILGELVRRRTYLVDFRLLDAQGRPRYYSMKFGAERDADGGVSSFAMGLYDVHDVVAIERAAAEAAAEERVRAQERLEATEKTVHELEAANAELARERDRARAAEKAKSFFFSAVSHDIRTPLNAITGYAEMLRLGIQDDAERKEALDTVLLSSKTLLQLINDVLDLSKLEAGKMEIQPEPVDAASLVAGVAAAFRPSASEKGVELLTEIAPMPYLRLDPQRIRQILFNLVGNAVKFTSRGSVTVRAAYDAGEGGTGTFRFEVADTGMGISEEDQLRIAQPYTQLGDPSSRRGGTGLGLAICRQLISRMQGEIELASALGRGSTFYVTIPGVADADDAARRSFSTTQQIRLTVSGAGTVRMEGRVLVVDDSPVNQRVLKALLARFGVRDVDTASSGVEALERLAACAYRLVLSDLWMPQMDGEALVREIRRNPAWADLPVYAVTADVEARKDYRSCGFTGILLKPLTLEKMRDLFIELRSPREVSV